MASILKSSFSGQPRAELYTMASKFSFEQLNNPVMALEYILQSLEHAPNDPHYELHASTMYLVSNQPREASRFLQLAISHDYLGIHKQRIERLQTLLNLAPGSVTPVNPAPPPHTGSSDHDLMSYTQTGPDTR